MWRKASNRTNAGDGRRRTGTRLHEQDRIDAGLLKTVFGETWWRSRVSVSVDDDDAGFGGGRH